ncbi:MAG: DUF494 domain-containing protein [Gammaproteobacteria bacterium]|nr:DUF494 domain-containing protein [Gammaproteobacteria bacterium]
MKENVFDVLMYLFEHYMDEALELKPDKASVKKELDKIGFPKTEINKAFVWLEDLVRLQESSDHSLASTNYSIRVFSGSESKKLDVECRGFLLFLEQLGVLNSTTREVVIERVMALESLNIDLDQLKWIILMVLFNQPGEEAAFAWLEDFVYDEPTGSIALH